MFLLPFLFCVSHPHLSSEPDTEPDSEPDDDQPPYHVTVPSSDSEPEVMPSESEPETTYELPPPAIDIGAWPFSVAVLIGPDFKLLDNKDNSSIRSAETLTYDSSSIGVISPIQVSLTQDQQHDMLYEATIYNMRRLIGRINSDPVVRANQTLPFMIQTLDIGIPPLISTFVKEAWLYTTAERALTSYLGQLRELAETKLNPPVENVVLTVPVSFNRFQLNWILYACKMAGLNVLELMPQPTAVALLYAQNQLQPSSSSSSSSSSHEDMDSESSKTAVIFNMDSGYCDVAVTTATERECQMKALAGSAIGGEDLLRNLMQHLLQDSENKLKNHLDGDRGIKSMNILRAGALKAIHQLSSHTSVEFDLDLGDGLKICKVVTRQTFEDINKEVFEKCESLIKQCLKDADVQANEINDVIIVGGCFYIPRVKKLVTDTCEVTRLYTRMEPLTAAVCGAAVAGAIASGIHNPGWNLDMLTSHVTPLTVGIRANGNDLVPVIPRNSTVPAKNIVDFTTVLDDQSEALILVYEGEEKKAEQDQLLGYLKITGIPAAHKGVPKIRVSMDIDVKNKLRVVASVYIHGSQQQPAMEAMMPVTDDGHFLQSSIYQCILFSCFLRFISASKVDV